MKLSKLCEKYLNGKISKAEYASQVFFKYEELLDYKRLLSESDTCEIKINEEGVFFDILLLDNNNNEYHIIMKLWDNDIAQVPATITTFGHYEKDELNMVSLMFDYLPENSVMFDIGANLGWYALNVKKQKPHVTVYAFEPILETYKKMNCNFKINNLDIHSYNFGFFNENTEINFYYDIVASGASSMRDLRGLDTTVCEKCCMKKLDDFFYRENIFGLDFIKCDVEGSELFVYQGGMECIKQYTPVVFSEMLRKWSAKFGYHPNDIINLFQTIGYGCYVMNGRKKLKELSFVTEDTVETNYFFLNEKKHRTIIEGLVE